MQHAHLDLLAAVRPSAAPQVTVLLGAGPALEAALQAALAPLAAGARIIRASNPLRSPLTIERILIQAGEAEIGLLPDDLADEAMQRLCQRRTGESRVVLVIERAETLSASALRTLSRLVAPSGRPAGPGSLLHLILAGEASLKQHVSKDPALAPLRDALPAWAEADPVAMPPRPAVQLVAPPASPDMPAPPTLPAAPVALPFQGVAPEALPVQHPAAPRPGRFPALQALAVLAILSAVGAGSVVGLPYALGWLGLP